MMSEYGIISTTLSAVLWTIKTKALHLSSHSQIYPAQWLSRLDNLKILDVGSYNGDITYLKRLNPSWDLFGYDISKKKVHSSKKKCSL